MTHQARGPFEVRMTPQPADPANPQAHGRMVLDKTYHGELTGTGRGEMLAWRDGGSGVYVAIERVSGVLAGRAGEFTLCHRGVMDADGQQLSISVAPDSATGELAGLRGEMKIVIAPGGAHAYELDYELP